MLIASIPYKFSVLWGNSATPTTYITNPIPPVSVGVAAGQDLGFPPITAQPTGSGGTPPNINDVNGALYYVSAWARWQQAGAPVFYDAVFSAAISGYPLGSVLDSATIAGQKWRSTVDGNTTDPDAGGAGWQQFPVPTVTGQCRLVYTNTTTVTLLPYNGDTIIIDGVSYTIPAAGLSIAPSAASTLYYVYAYNNAGNVALALSTTGHSTDATAGNVGIEIQTGSSLYSLVGMAATNASSQFQLQGVGTASWFNRKGIETHFVGISTTTTSTSAVELSSSYRVPFVCWGDTTTRISAKANAANSASGDSTGIYAGLDGSVPANAIECQMYSNPPGAFSGTSAEYIAVLSEGVHTASPFGAVGNPSTGTYSNGGMFVEVMA